MVGPLLETKLHVPLGDTGGRVRSGRFGTCHDGDGNE
jgi:hypothetical protein